MTLARLPFRLSRTALTGFAALALSATALAQNANEAARSKDGPTLNLEAAASQRVPEDTAWATFSVEKESRDQAQAQQTGRAALAELTAVAKKYPQLQVSTDSLFTSPSYDKNGKITNWRTHFTMRIESTDTAQVAQAMSDLMDKARLSGSGFTLSTAARKKAQDQLIATAVQEFEAKAKVTAAAMGFARFSYDNVALQQSNNAMPRVAMYSAAADAGISSKSAPAPVTLEPGKTEVSVSVSGSVRLLK
ncbi:MAG: SIMPL domain-containing protein [Comamonas sp.]